MELEIIDTALENLTKTAGIDTKWTPNGPLDGTAIFKIDGNKYVCVTEIKRELRQHQIPQIEHYKQTQKNLIIVAEKIFPKIKKQLRDLGIAYLEANGNIFIKTNQIYLFIDTNKPYKVRKKTSNRAFTKTGLKVLFHFLVNPMLINKTHREIAEQTGVALGNIPQVINGLKETGYIIAADKKNYIWENKIELINRWINDYAVELRPKTVKGKYKVPYEWRDIRLNTEITVWGGEPAADLLTNYLRPEKLLLHTKENNINLIKNYKLIPDKEGQLEALDIFWEKDTKIKTAPPILVYAELMIEGGKRNEEVAQIIFNEYIEPNL
ncbi:type IV toxin-antitoxin system AbiEi family antitoxin [Fulvivirgaceae bacterium BMA10]|uniref:Type IV toxin-antitoxin system AbiEi family antitoxin n=1 Tax=Splendidivirga corallicola TaxID=3051826 RepID=A0ABT8KPZ2_9BACT|nr:type IV toxin-antitoxin system AbiEi family antitoxin [Fulvivirgaceae bacterium BMA10]